MAQGNTAAQAPASALNWRFLVLAILVPFLLFSSQPPVRNPPPSPAGTDAPLADSVPFDGPASATPPQPVGGVHSPLFPEGSQMSISVYLSEDEEMDFTKNPKKVWTLEGLKLGDWNREEHHSITFTPSENLQNNGTFYAHLFLHPDHKSPNPSDPNYAKPYIDLVHPLTKYVRKDLARFAKKNLISGEVDEAWLEREDWEAKRQELGLSIESNVKILSHWKGNLTINLVHDFTKFKPKSFPDSIIKQMRFAPTGQYYPTVFLNDFWLLDEDLLMINDTVKSLTLDMHYAPMSMIKFSLYNQIDESFNMQRTMLGADDSETQEVKRMFLDNNPYILAATVIISFVHMILDTLAFKNEIQFWREKKSMEGMSVRTIYINVITNLIVLLYLLDNNTSWMVLFSVGLGLLIELWKITRAAKVTIGYWRSIPYPIVTDKDEYVSSLTKDHDLHAMKYLYYSLFPLVIGYSIYSLIYDTHKSWYSFVVSTLAGCVYTFGFIAMTPQLFINYKLKSVAHLPWRVFIYKAISTFIDDLFAFLIRMPTMHRLRVFRDDIIFLLYLYQRYIYPVDMRRVEVGTDFADIPVEELELAKAEMMAKAGGNTTTESKKNQ